MGWECVLLCRLALKISIPLPQPPHGKIIGVCCHTWPWVSVFKWYFVLKGCKDCWQDQSEDGDLGPTSSNFLFFSSPGQLLSHSLHLFSYKSRRFSRFLILWNTLNREVSGWAGMGRASWGQSRVSVVKQEVNKSRKADRKMPVSRGEKLWALGILVHQVDGSGQ